MNKTWCKNNKGITLVALIIMVIMLLILTAVTVDIVIGNDYFGKAQSTIDKANSQMSEQDKLASDVRNAWEATPGKIIKSPTKVNTTIEISAVTSNITKNSFRINAKGTNANNDILTFTLTVEGLNQKFEEKKPTTYDEEVYWDVTGLNPNTTYEFTIVATNDYEENSVTGSETTLSNSVPTVFVSTNTTSTSATITATGYDSDDNELKFKLIVDETTYESTQTTNTPCEWIIDNLTPNTTYSYTVKVSDDNVVTWPTTSTGNFTTLLGNERPYIDSFEINTTRTTASISVIGNDEDEDLLEYSIWIYDYETNTEVLSMLTDGTKYKPGEQKEWTVNDLEPCTQYYAFIEVYDETNWGANIDYFGTKGQFELYLCEYDSNNASFVRGNYIGTYEFEVGSTFGEFIGDEETIETEYYGTKYGIVYGDVTFWKEDSANFRIYYKNDYYNSIYYNNNLTWMETSLLLEDDAEYWIYAEYE